MSTVEREATAPPRPLLPLCLATLGIVYGDIGTSPLYALRECFAATHGLDATRDNVLGVLSLVLWSLIIVISIKYTLYILRFDNRGEGGILALLGLLNTSTRGRGGRVLVLLGLFGAALLYGDGVITPAISVLSAVEGLEVKTHLFAPFVVPVSVFILVGLFLIQRRGTARIAAWFGPVMIAWFLTLSVLGIAGILREPGVLVAINPLEAVRFFLRNGMAGFLVLGAVFLAVTGGEAMYADMGHFGARPVRLTWLLFVGPALALNYFGQGALLMTDPRAAANPFYLLAPPWALLPLVALSTLATIIASQAMISGSFSLTRQAVQLGYLPRVEVRHTSPDEIGQIYVPWVNWALMLGTIALVLGFRSSGALAAAYGIAVTSTMVITTVLAFFVTRERYRWRLPAALGITIAFVIPDLAFLVANAAKVLHGGWFPLAVAGALFILMRTWWRGREILHRRREGDMFALDLFMTDLRATPPARVPGTAVFMANSATGVPPALLHNLKHNHVLHEQVVLLTVMTTHRPKVPRDEKIQLESLGLGVTRVILRFGFMEDPNVPAQLARIRSPDLRFEPMHTSYFLGKETLMPSGRHGLGLWRTHLFALMSRNARTATAFFRLPPNRVVELGTQLEI